MYDMVFRLNSVDIGGLLSHFENKLNMSQSAELDCFTGQLERRNVICILTMLNSLGKRL